MSTLQLNKPEDIEVFLDPFRSKILRMMKNRYKPMTVKEIADEMGQSPAKVYYHIKKLEAIGVLYIKYTKQINGIVAKYYDFTTDSIALDVPDNAEGTDLLRSQLMIEYGQYFDEAKQKFFDLYNGGPEKPLEDKAVYMTVNDRYPVEPGKISEMYDEIKAIFKKYRCETEDAIDYSVFISMIQNTEIKKK